MPPLQTLRNRVRSLFGLSAPSVAPGGMGRVVLSTARDRWLTASVSAYTPDRVEQILRSAFTGDLRAQWELFDLMEGTWPRLAKNLNELKQALEDCDWPLQPWSADGEDPTPEAIRRKKVVEAAIWHCEPDPTIDEGDFGDLVRDLADAWGKGISVQELHWAPRRHEGGTLIGLRAASWVHPRLYGYPASDSHQDRLMLRVAELTHDNPQALAALAGLPAFGSGTSPVTAAPVAANAEWVPFPRDKFLIGIAKMKTGHAIGAAMLRPLAWWWAVGNFTGEWLVALAQIFGVPIRWATYAQGTPTDQITRIEEMLENMGSAAWGAFPSGTTLELKEAVRSGQDNPQIALMEIVDRVCDLLVLGQTLTSDAGDRGTQALGTVHAEVLTGRKRALVNWVAKTLNQQLIPAICRLNFGDTLDCPYFVIGDEETEDAKAVAETFEIVLRSGMAIPKRFAYDKLGIPEPADGDEVIGPSAGLSPGQLTAPGGDPAAAPQPAGPSAVTDARGGERYVFVQASAAQRKLAERIAEDATGVERKWLGGAVPWFVRLIEAARDPRMSDAEFIRFLEAKARNVPEELLPLLNDDALAEAMEVHLGASVVNGAVDGWMKRRSVARR